MPYRNIHWIKLEKRLLNDYRFNSLSEESQLIFLKLLMLAAETNNKIPKNPDLIKSALRSNQSANKIEEYLKEIKANFPKFKENKWFYFFKEWSNRCNWIAQKELLRNSSGTAGEVIDKNRIDKNILDKIIKEYITLQGWTQLLADPLKYSVYYKQCCSPAKRLVLLAGSEEYALRGLKYIGTTFKNKNFRWTLHTIIEHFPDFMKKYPQEDKTPQAVKELVKGISDKKNE